MCENGQDGQVGYVAILAMLATLPVTPSAFTIEVKGDSKREGNETFDLDLYGLSVGYFGINGIALNSGRGGNTITIEGTRPTRRSCIRAWPTRLSPSCVPASGGCAAESGSHPEP